MLNPEPRSQLPACCADQIRTLSTQRLTKKIDALPTGDAAKLRHLTVEMYGTA
ncbi:MAG: hypothetical protein HZA93_15520 [Verrucomicrobia bacterium]|nr:hypothetical protein [Verrucomicrobiota bacterium]